MTTKPRLTAEARLGRLQIRVVLQGEWENFRQFIYELESAPEFVIIDNVELSGSTSEAAGGQVVTLEMSTYFRDAV